MQLNSAHLPMIGKGGQGTNICKWGLIQDQAPRQAPGCSFSQKKKKRKVRGRAQWSNQLPNFEVFISDLGPAGIHPWLSLKHFFLPFHVQNMWGSDFAYLNFH